MEKKIFSEDYKDYEPPFCPLRGASTSGEHFTGLHSCVKEKCALWVKDCCGLIHRFNER
jgi:hypothetical protein